MKRKNIFLCSNIANALATATKNKDDDIFKKLMKILAKTAKKSLILLS